MTRFHELDALRAFAMLLGVVLHASMFLVWPEWPVVAKEISPDLPYDDIVHAIHGFRMPVFFLLSGFFTAMLWRRHGGKETDQTSSAARGSSIADRRFHDCSDPCLVDRDFEE